MMQRTKFLDIFLMKRIYKNANKYTVIKLNMIVTSEYKGDPLLQILDKNFLGNPSIIILFLEYNHIILYINSCKLRIRIIHIVT